jgi:uncharacterized membrane protein YhaH (DUF805 family)
MFKWYKKVVFENYANFNGRARREEFWYYNLAGLIISIILMVIDNVSGLTFGEAQNGILRIVYSLVLFIPGLAVGIRRMHDVGKSGWYSIIPIYNLILACTEGDEGTNEYGSDPKNIFDELEEIGKE